MRRTGPGTVSGGSAWTIGFIVAMIPLLILTALVAILSLLVLSPVAIYVGSTRGKALKNRQNNAGSAPG